MYTYFIAFSHVTFMPGNPNGMPGFASMTITQDIKVTSKNVGDALKWWKNHIEQTTHVQNAVVISFQLVED